MLLVAQPGAVLAAESPEAANGERPDWWSAWLPDTPFDGDQPRVSASEPPPNTEQLLPDRELTIWGLEGGPARAGVWRQTPDGGSEELVSEAPPIRFGEDGNPRVDGTAMLSLRNAIEELGGREGLRLHVVGHTDGAPISPSQRAIHGDAQAVSEAYARLVATYLRSRLELPEEAVTWAGAGASDTVADPATAEGRRRNRRVEVRAWYQDPERRARERERYVPQPKMRRVRVCRQETACVVKRRRRDVRVVQLKNAVDPIRFANRRGELPEGTFDALAERLEALGDVPNLRVRFVGHTDAAALDEAARKRFGDAEGLARAYAREVARAARERLGLGPHQVMVESRGAADPVAPNGTARGRALNRRVAVEIWHDARGSGSTVSDVRACPAEGELREYVTEPYRPDGEDPIDPVPFVDGEPRITDDWIARLERVLDELGDARNPRVNFIGHVERELLDRRAARIYGDARGLSEVRARRVMKAVAPRLEDRDVELTFEGKGFGEPLRDPSLSARQAPDGRVRVEILRDVAVPPDPDWIENVVEVTRETEPASPYSLAPMRITVDGERVGDGMPHTADVQRCTDAALDEASIQVRYDRGGGQRRLNVTATPPTIALDNDPDTDVHENRTTFHGFSNYGAFIERAEVRLYEPGEPTTATPVDVVPLGPDMRATWSPSNTTAKGLKYVLRVYDDAGRFDETAPRRLWLVHELDDAGGDRGGATRARLAGLDESLLQRRNIPVEGGVVTVTGKSVPSDHTPWVMGEPVTIDDDRDFVIQRIVPRGLHTVEVALLDGSGNGDVYLRDLQVGDSDWYTIGMADITVGIDDTSGPARLVTQDDQHYNSSTWVDGRMAFYTNGEIDAGWEITASADTREGPLDEIFSNFVDKNPDALFRRLDGDRYYPTFGDDSTVVEDAPTSGKFYVRAEKNETFGMWGNFEAEILDNELAQIDRGLYGAYGHYEGTGSTSFGERRTEVDLFGAEPGTVAAREEFRGTGGSLYFLEHQDIVQGSERIRVEVRDRESGLVLEANSLVAGEDYDIDPIQGRVILTSPLPSSADASELVQAGGSLAGNPVFLVVRYEYTPGFEDLDGVAVGGRVSRWLGENLELGVTANEQEQVGAEQSLAGVDATWRESSDTWLRVESAETDGVGTQTLLSDDGGFGFEPQPLPDEDASANAWRVEGSADFSDLVLGTEGRATAYVQQREAGFSAPGQTTTRDVDQAGGTLAVPLGERTRLQAKVDQRAENDGLTTGDVSTDVAHRLDERWEISGGVRHNRRDDDSPAVPDTQTEGRRTDLGIRLDYTPAADWSAYTFGQFTADKTGSRADNDRLGLGGEMQITDRLRGSGELSGGSTGTGARVGTEYLYSQDTRLYGSYSLDNEREARTGVLERQGQFVTGFRTRYSEATTVYGEERYAHGDVPTGLTHAYGVDTQLTSKWSFGISGEVGTLENPRTGAETERRALGLSSTHTGDSLDYRGAVELRSDETETSERTTYLLKNRLEYRLTEADRLIGKLNLSDSDSSQGEFFDGEFVEAVMGYGHRPVNNDRWNTLFKYTYFFNLPAPDQEIAAGSSSDFIQRSHVLSADTIYELTPEWSLGAKYAYRLGELANSRENPEFFESRAELVVLRADWHVLRRWDLLVEGRRLELIDAEDTRSGALVGIYHHFGDHVKLGVGYNFTDFSDDLTDLSYDSQGAFINLVGKY